VTQAECEAALVRAVEVAERAVKHQREAVEDAQQLRAALEKLAHEVEAHVVVIPPKLQATLDMAARVVVRVGWRQ
jgi:hypothetical protein